MKSAEAAAATQPAVPVKAPGTDAGTFDWSTLEGNNAAVSLVPEAVARKYLAFPARVENGRLVVVMAEPTDYRAIQTLELKARMEVTTLHGSAEDIRRAIDIHYSGKMDEGVIKAMDRRFSEEEEGHASGSEVREIALVTVAAEGPSAAEESPVILAVDSLISQAVKARATDIHIEPMADRVRVRFRIDGFLKEYAKLPLAAHGAALSRLKIMAGMDIAERRRPQDGHFSARVGENTLEVRAATTDTVHGEMAVLRILNKNIELFKLDELGMLEDTVSTIRKLLKSPYGILLVCGPTGAGKTTTLYASLGQLDKLRMNIITIEDPVEYRFEGVNSIQINEKAGLTFPGSLRATLRLDPNVIMVGEMRDPETAHIGVQAALTGHLVLSTVHANDAVRAMNRMLDLGVESFLLSSALLGVASQRMVRKVCTHCRVAYVPEGEEAALCVDMGLDPAMELSKGEGCYFCAYTGFRGRTGIYEVLTITEPIRAMILRRATAPEMLEEARKGGFKTMKEDGARKIALGITTPAEIMRSVYTA